jgi:hypothetical protein
MIATTISSSINVKPRVSVVLMFRRSPDESGAPAVAHPCCERQQRKCQADLIRSKHETGLKSESYRLPPGRPALPGAKTATIGEHEK